MVSRVSLLMGIFSSGLVPVTSRPLVHSPLGGWRGCPRPHSAPPRAAGGSGSRERRKVSGHRSGLQGDGKFSGPLTLRGDAPNGGECAMGPPEVVYQGLGLRGLERLPCPGMADPSTRSPPTIWRDLPVSASRGKSRVHARPRDKDRGAS